MVERRVAHELCEAEQFARRVIQRLYGIRSPKTRTVFAHVPTVMLSLYAAECAVQLVLRFACSRVLGGEDDVEWSADDLRLRKAERLLSTGVPAHDNSAR